MTSDLTILGAGIAGLSAAYFAEKEGMSSIVYEASRSVGGLLDNFEINGFRFDNAVHLSFAQEPEVREVFDQAGYSTLPAEPRCFDNGIWLKHPAQNNLYPLPVDDRVELLSGFVNRPEIIVETYEDWLLHQYGEAISVRYPLRYTKKYWTVEARELGVNWVGNRMRRAEFKEVLRGSMTGETPNTYYTSVMRYPKKGGFKSFIEPLYKDANIQLEKKVSGLDVGRKLIEFSDGSECSYENLISSLPLPMLVRYMNNAPKNVKSAAESLYATSIDLVSVGFSSDIINDLWFYIYDEDILAARAYSPSVKSKNNVPKNKSSLQFEIYSSRNTGKPKTKEELIENTLYAIEKLKIATRKDVLFTHHKKIKFGNVVFDKGMEDRREIVREYLASKDIKSIGRFGEWDYLWSNQSMMSGKKAVDDIIKGQRYKQGS